LAQAKAEADLANKTNDANKATDAQIATQKRLESQLTLTEKLYQNTLDQIKSLVDIGKVDIAVPDIIKKLDEIVNHSKLSKINKFKFFLISEKYDKFARYLLFSLVILVFLDITLKIVFDIKWFSPIYNLYLVCYWLLLIYRHKLISTKKP